MHLLSHSVCTMTCMLTPFLLVFPLCFSHRIPISQGIQWHLHMFFPVCMCEVPLIAKGWLTLGSWVCVRNWALRPGANWVQSISAPIKWFWIEEE